MNKKLKIISFLRSTISQSSRTVKTALPFTLTISVISSLQVLYLILKMAFPVSKHEQYPLFDAIRILTAYVSDVQAYLPLCSTTEKSLMAWGMLTGYLIIHVGVLIVLLIYLAFNGPERGGIYAELLNRASLIHSRVLFFIIHYFLLGVMAQFKKCKLEERHVFYCSREYLILTILLVCVNMGLAIIKECLMYQVNCRGKNTYAVKDNLYYKIILMHKSLIIILYFLTEDRHYSVTILAVANVLISGVSIALLYTKLPFYNILVLKLSLISSGVALAFSLFHIVSLTGLNQFWLDFTWLILTALFLKTLLAVFDRLLDRVRHGVIKSPEEALLYVSLLKQAQFGYLPNTPFPFKTDRNVIIAYGLFVDQKTSSPSLANLKKAGNKKHHKALIYTYILERMSNLADKNPNSKLLLLSMADICLMKLENIPRALEHIRQLERCSLPIYLRNSLDDLNCSFKKKQAIKHYSDTQRGSKDDHLRLLEYFESRDATKILMEHIRHEVDKHLEFWDEIRRGVTDVKKTLDIACEIDILSREIKTQWMKQSQRDDSWV